MDNISGKKVLVTGADGFIGSHLVEELLAKGAKVRAFVYYNSWNNIGWLKELPENLLKQIEIFTGDIRDPFRVNEAVSGCNYIFHLSSLIAIPYSYHAPDSYIQTNISGALNVLQACRNSKDLIRLLHVSTSEVYGTAQTVPINEAHPLVGQSPYSASKIGADKIAESFHLSFNLPVVTARPFNTFGPRQTARAVIPTIASQLLCGSKELRLGALDPTRDFNYVTDTAKGMIALASCKEAEGQVINIGTGEEWSIEKTAKMLMELTGVNVPIICEAERIRPEKSEVNRLLACNKKIKTLTNWSPEATFQDGLAQTAKWIEKNIHLFNIKEYSI